jgi:hypothetical protein
MRMHVPEWVKPGFWGAFAGVAAVAIVAFSAGWVVTSESAQRTAQSQSSRQ